MTIEEKAMEFALIEKRKIEGVEYADYNAQKIEGFIFGANAVLDEIENIISLKYDEISTYELIEDKIKELKGE